MKITGGHFLYIFGLIITFLISLFFLLSDKLDFLFSEKLFNQKTQRVAVAMIGIILLVFGVFDLIFNWNKVDFFGRLFK